MSNCIYLSLYILNSAHEKLCKSFAVVCDNLRHFPPIQWGCTRGLSGWIARAAVFQYLRNCQARTFQLLPYMHLHFYITGWVSYVLSRNTVSLCFIASIGLIPTSGWIQQLLFLNHPLWSMYVMTCRRWKGDNNLQNYWLNHLSLMLHVSISFFWLQHCNNTFCRSKANWKVENLSALVRSRGTCPKLTWRKKTWGRCNRMKGKDVDKKGVEMLVWLRNSILMSETPGALVRCYENTFLVPN